MQLIRRTFIFGFFAFPLFCAAQQKNPLICDPAAGVCEKPAATVKDQKTKEKVKTLKAVYYTDPICSSCWGIEPQLRRLKLEYGSDLEIEYRMGGLLPDWSYNSGGISKPSDVAHHWDEVSKYYDMPIDGDVWLQDPLDSSYPPSIAFKAAQLQDREKALKFMRIMREMVFLKKINIAKWDNISTAAQKSGLNIVQLKADYEGRARALFEQDLRSAQQSGVRGFPTIILTNKAGRQEIIYGSKPYAAFESAVHALDPKSVKAVYSKTWKDLFAKHPSLTAREFAELSDKPRTEAEAMLNQLTKEGSLEKFTTKNGAIWYVKK